VTVVVLSVLTGALAGLAEHVARPLRHEVEALRSSGAAVEVIEMGQDALDACGANLMNFAAVGDVADAGRAQARESADRVGAVWG
jgi:hypothetical protein